MFLEGDRAIPELPSLPDAEPQDVASPNVWIRLRMSDDIVRLHNACSFWAT